jgi:DNA invertase Pin-like site-specific DNA recombinase
MGRKPIERTAPDLFTTETASALPATEEASESELRRYVLPKNLRNAVKHLSDGELDLMHAATLEELKRRGKTPKSVEAVSHARPNLVQIQSPPAKKRRHVDIAEVPLTRGQVNAVRAAFKAGITPSRIARQFGISQSSVRKALASDERNP